MALTPSTDQFPILGIDDATPRYRRRRTRTWRDAVYENATDAARQLPWALVGNAVAAVVILAVIGLVVPRAGDALAVAGVLAVLAGAGVVTWKATNR